MKISRKDRLGEDAIAVCDGGALLHLHCGPVEGENSQLVSHPGYHTVCMGCPPSDQAGIRIQDHRVVCREANH